MAHTERSSVTGAWIAGITEEVLLTHQPTGIMAKGATKGEALAKLATVLIGRGDITINDGRAAMGLPPFDPPLDAVDFIAKGHLGTPCPKPRDGGLCGCDEDDEPPPKVCLGRECDC